MAEEIHDVQEYEQGGPDITWLSGRFADVLGDNSPFIDQCVKNYNTRYAIWDGQNQDGKKRGNNAFPWEGASDLQVFAVDEIINADVALMKTALRKANLMAVPVEGNDIARAKTVSNFLKWLVRCQIPNLEREEELCAQFVREKGIAATGVFWERRVALKYETIEAQTMPPEMQEMLAEPENDVVMGDTLRQVYPDLTKAAAKLALVDLREKGTADVVVPGQTLNRPVVRAFSLDEDLLIPASTTDLEGATDIYEIRYLTADQMRERVISEEWDENWVENCIEATRGAPRDGTLDERKVGQSRVGYDYVDNQEGLIRVVTAYQRLSDENGVPGIYRTIFSPDIMPKQGKGKHKGYALYGLLPYKHGEYPFIIHRSEYLSRRLHDTRGVPEVGKPFQDQIKVQRDAQVDNTSMSTLPAMEHPIGRAPASIGPGSKLPVRRRGEYGYMERPPFPGVSFQLEERLEKTFNRYFGRPTDETDASDARMKRQDMTESWLRSWVKVYSMVYSLYKQYGDDQEYFRVIGSVNSKPELFEKGDPNEKHDIYLTFDILTNDPEYQLNRVKAIMEIAQVADRDGQTRWGELYQVALEAIDPILGERIVEPKETATEREMDEEKNAISRIVAGIDEDIKLGGAHQMRMQVLQQWVESEAGQQLLNNQQTPWVPKLLEKRAKQHQMQMMQQENAKIGRYGA